MHEEPENEKAFLRCSNKKMQKTVNGNSNVRTKSRTFTS